MVENILRKIVCQRCKKNSLHRNSLFNLIPKREKERKKREKKKEKEGKEKGEKRKKEIFAFSVVFMLVINFKLKITRNNETERNIFFSFY